MKKNETEVEVAFNVSSHVFSLLLCVQRRVVNPNF